MDRQILIAVCLAGAFVCFFFYLRRRRARKMKQMH
jgi:hypothetical protein